MTAPPQRDAQSAALAGDHGEAAGTGVEPMPLTPPEFDAMIAKEIQMNIALAKAARLKFN